MARGLTRLYYIVEIAQIIFLIFFIYPNWSGLWLGICFQFVGITGADRVWPVSSPRTVVSCVFSIWSRWPLEGSEKE